MPAGLRHTATAGPSGIAWTSGSCTARPSTPTNGTWFGFCPARSVVARTSRGRDVDATRCTARAVVDPVPHAAALHGRHGRQRDVQPSRIRAVPTGMTHVRHAAQFGTWLTSLTAVQCRDLQEHPRPLDNDGPSLLRREVPVGDFQARRVVQDGDLRGHCRVQVDSSQQVARTSPAPTVRVVILEYD
jgi:hypothetical protein